MSGNMSRACLASPLPASRLRADFRADLPTDLPSEAAGKPSAAFQLLQQRQQGWQVLSISAVPADPIMKTASLQALADLMSYGIVGPLAELATGSLLWLPIFPQLSEAELRELHLASLLKQGPTPSFSIALEWQSRTQFGSDAAASQTAATPPTQADNLAHARILSGTRSLCAGLQLPLVDLRLLNAMFAAASMPTGPLALVWPASVESAAGFLAQMQPGLRQALLAQQEILRQMRRQALQLPVDIEAAALDRCVYQHLILPAAQYYLQLGSQAACANQRNDLYLVAESPTGCDTLKLPYTQFSLHDPLGENLYALALRRLCFSKRRSPLKRQFKIAPRALTRQVQGLGAAQQDGAAQAMLAALQLDFLHSESL